MDGGSVTLIFYKIPTAWYREPLLNIVAAAFQNSSFTHVELAIGSAAGASGEMTNVARIFNDDTGAELVSRTGRNPQYTYVQLGCSKEAETAMLRYARSCVGKPFSNSAMFRSILWPRTTDEQSFFCAELVAAILQKGGLLSSTSNPGAATPETLHQMYSKRGAVTANPWVLRDVRAVQQLTTQSLGKSGTAYSSSATSPPVTQGPDAEQNALLIQKALNDARGAKKIGTLHVVAGRRSNSMQASNTGVTLSLHSLDMRRHPSK